MTTDPDLSAVRWGYGLPAPTDAGPAALMSRLAGPDRAVRDWPGVTQAEAAAVFARARQARRAKDDAAVRAALGVADGLALRGMKATLVRAVSSDDSLRERLVAFWADHFTVAPRNRIERCFVTLLVDEAIRPHVTAPFATMLRAVVTHPALLVYLNQETSIGPGSRKGVMQRRGLNENLARELLELHTIGVEATYTQTDVRELAELLTGLSVDPDRAFRFDPTFAEPGAETVLGVTYSGAGMDPILMLLDDLAIRPETAAHLARKLAVHFVADDPDPALVAAIEARWIQTGGNLLEVTDAMLGHPAAWSDQTLKVRQPFDFIVAALRALGVPPEAIMAYGLRDARRMILAPLVAMGQPFQQAPGPDGWPERASDWISPQGLAARIDWAMVAPQRLVQPLPDPRAFLQRALGRRAGERLTWAVSAAESARDGVGLVLASPEFNRR